MERSIEAYDESRKYQSRHDPDDECDGSEDRQFAIWPGRPRWSKNDLGAAHELRSENVDSRQSYRDDPHLGGSA